MTEAARVLARAVSERANKFGAKTVEADGYRFASKAEARRYEELRLMALAGDIRDLIVHPKFVLWAPIFTDERPGPDADEAPATLKLCEGEYGPRCWARRIGFYTADFAYMLVGELKRETVVEDVKGGKATRTEAYRLRKRIVEACYGITVVEVQA